MNEPNYNQSKYFRYSTLTTSGVNEESKQFRKLSEDNATTLKKQDSFQDTPILPQFGSAQDTPFIVEIETQNHNKIILK